MTDQRYYVVLSEESEYDINRSRVINHLGCFDQAYDALERFLLFYNADKYFLYSYPIECSTGELLNLKKVPSELPNFSQIRRCLTN